MHAVNKKTLGTYTCDSESQCRVEEGNTNPFLSNPRVVEDVLKYIEPVYNNALEKLRQNRLDSAAIMSLVGFAAYVEGNSPAGMRIHSGPLKASVEEAATIIDPMGKIPKPPPQLGGHSLTELLNSGDVVMTVDPKYAQSIAVETMLKRVSNWGNSRWEIILNSFEDNPFFTSDYLIGIELSATDNRILNRIVPLAPDIAIRILPDMDAKREVDLEFSNLRTRMIKPSRSQIRRLNQIIVKCAEKTVYYRDDHPWVLPFVKKTPDIASNQLQLKFLLEMEISLFQRCGFTIQTNKTNVLFDCTPFRRSCSRLSHIKVDRRTALLIDTLRYLGHLQPCT